MVRGLKTGDVNTMEHAHGRCPVEVGLQSGYTTRGGLPDGIARQGIQSRGTREVLFLVAGVGRHLEAESTDAP